MIASTILLRAREVYGDTDTVNPGVVDAILFDLLNQIVRPMWRMNPRPTSRSATTMGWNAIASSTKSILSSVTDIIDTPDGPAVLGAFLEAAAGDVVIGTPLRKMRPARILQLQNSDSTTGTIARYSVERAATQTEADSGKVLIRFHPIPSGTSHVSARVIAEPETIDAGADGFDLDDDASYAAAKILALHAAPLIRQPPDKIEAIRSSIPAIYRSIWEGVVPPQRVAGEA